jgi:hypothetical protein
MDAKALLIVVWSHSNASARIEKHGRGIKKGIIGYMTSLYVH